jgi:chaperone BCS1
LGITYKRCYLFEGPPGSGKSSLIYGLASIFNLDISYLNISDELKCNSLIDAIRKIPKKSILVIEDIDAIFEKRDKKDNSQRITFSALLNSIDGVIKPSSGSLIIFTTNYKDKLDEALKRPGRIDKIISFDYVKREQVEKMFKFYFPKSNEDENILFNKFYDKIKNIKKMNICYLQQFFLKYLKKMDDMYDNINELTQIIEECDLYKKPTNLYC